MTSKLWLVNVFLLSLFRVGLIKSKVLLLKFCMCMCLFFAPNKSSFLKLYLSGIVSCSCVPLSPNAPLFFFFELPSHAISWLLSLPCFPPRSPQIYTWLTSYFLQIFTHMLTSQKRLLWPQLKAVIDTPDSPVSQHRTHQCLTYYTIYFIILLLTVFLLWVCTT